MRLEDELGHDAEVAAAAADRPEEIRMLVGAGRDLRAVREHEFRREEVVDRQPVAAREVAVPAAERQAGDARGRDDPARNREPVLGGGRVDLLPQAAAADANGAASWDRPSIAFMQRQVADDSRVDAAQATAVVPAAANRERQVVLAREADHLRDLVGPGAAARGAQGACRSWR